MIRRWHFLNKRQLYESSCAKNRLCFSTQNKILCPNFTLRLFKCANLNLRLNYPLMGPQHLYMRCVLDPEGVEWGSSEHSIVHLVLFCHSAREKGRQIGQDSSNSRHGSSLLFFFACTGLSSCMQVPCSVLAAHSA